MQQVMCLRNCQDKWHVAETGESLWFETWTTIHSNFAQQLQYICWTTLNPRWMMQPTAPPTQPNFSLSKDVGDMTSWHAAAFSDSAEPTTHQALAPSSPIWLLYKMMFVTHLLIWSASAKAWRQRRSRLASCSWFYLPGKPDFWNPANNWHSTETCQISLTQNLENQSRNPRFHSASTYSMTYSWIGSIWQLNSIRDERWNYSTCKPSKLLTVRGCRKHDIMTCRSIQRFCGAHHTPGLGALGTNLVVPQIDESDALVDFKCLGQGLEAATDQGWHLVRGSTYQENLISETPRTIDIQLRHVESLRFKTWKNNPEIHSFIQHLHTVWQCMTYSWIGSIWQLNSIRDERWNYSNYSTCKPSKLLTVRGFRKHDIMTCRSIQRFCGASHTPGLGALGTNLVVIQIDVCDWPVYLQCLGQGL